MTKLTKTAIEAAKPQEKQITLWCGELKGFGAFIQPSGTRSYFVDYRNAQGKRRRMVLGRHGTITAEQARKMALEKLGSIVRGSDPLDDRNQIRKSQTVKQLCEHYLDLAERGLILGKGNRPKKPSTIYTDRGRIEQHIIPLLGSKAVSDLAKADIYKFIQDVACGKTAKVCKSSQKRGKTIVKGGSGTATRTTGLLGGILTHAISIGLIEVNPVHGVKRPACNRRTRRLTNEEYRELGIALEQASAEGEIEQGINAIWLLALTGCRRGEIVGAKWTELDKAGGCIRLEDSKEGASVRPIGSSVLEILNGIRKVDGNPYILTSVRNGGYFGGLPGVWRRVIKRTRLDGVTPHTLRHSYASVAGDLGFTESTIAAMLGHSAGTTTSRYIHHLDEVLIAAADKVASAIFQRMKAE